MFKILIASTIFSLSLMGKGHHNIELPVLFTSLWAYKKLDKGIYKEHNYDSGVYTERHDVILRDGQFYVNIKQHIAISCSKENDKNEEQIYLKEFTTTTEVLLGYCQYKDVYLGEGLVGGGMKKLQCPYDREILGKSVTKEIKLGFGLGNLMKLNNVYCDYLDKCAILSRNDVTRDKLNK